ncbi:MAG TPA: crosslink repair DNA glycosylase YcaQ family protein, partial [Acidobacteriota bacterium]
LQIDFANVLLPAHYQVPFSRLGPYRRSLLDELVYRRRQFTEQWAHEASIIPVASWPLLRHRMENHRVRPWGFEKFIEKHPRYVDWVLEQVEQRGPLCAAELETPEGVQRRIPGSWIGTVPRAVLEAHFGRGRMAVAHRTETGARSFDLAERVVPPDHLRRPLASDQAQRELILLAARACGIGTAADLADYYRMPVREARPRIAELLAAGALREVQVEGWRQPAYLDPRAARPRPIDARALLSPFDPLIWFRPRTARLFQFDYRFEIFVPPRQRRWGAYVLPFLLGERLVARVDLKSDRGGGRLLVQAAFLEPGVKAASVTGPLAAELETMATWLGLKAVSVGRRGNLAAALARAVRASAHRPLEALCPRL